MADWADIDAIRDYMNGNEKNLQMPAGKKLLVDFRAWYGSLSLVDRVTRVNEKVSEAKWYRDQANRLMGQPVLDPSTYPVSDAPPAKQDPTPHPPLIPIWAKAGLVVGGLLIAYHYISTSGDDE